MNSNIQFYTCVNIFHAIWASSIHIAHNGVGNRIRTPLLANRILKKCILYWWNSDRILSFCAKEKNILLTYCRHAVYFISYSLISRWDAFHLRLCQGWTFSFSCCHRKRISNWLAARYHSANNKWESYNMVVTWIG